MLQHCGAPGLSFELPWPSADAVLRRLCRPSVGASHIPLKVLDKDAARTLGDGTIFVLDSGDARTRQACVRLVSVFGLTAVKVEAAAASEE